MQVSSGDKSNIPWMRSYFSASLTVNLRPGNWLLVPVGGWPVSGSGVCRYQPEAVTTRVLPPFFCSPAMKHTSCPTGPLDPEISLRCVQPLRFQE